ncbi:flagellar basal body rod protein FlgC [Terracidiphilus gabretensis]|uniref:flagellar basal body rod protein FlgC n=1 Tax=Terracidiphilus gabretensis TaxID=1577687 RepID=UPI00071BA209|nr:flagellar basal body rod protein FlgC [Terracidiphilus gabretensis]
MNLFGLLETSGSAMQAERMRAEVVAANMANAETTRTADGGAYHRQHVIFAANTGNVELDPNFALAMNGAIGSPQNLIAPPPMPSFAFPGAEGEPAGGVHIAQVVQDPAAPLRRYDPGHPDAGPDGYVDYPDINPLTEMVDLMGATRAYGLNGSAVQAEKSMIGSALEIGKA